MPHSRARVMSANFFRTMATRGIRAHDPQWDYWLGYEWSPWHRTRWGAGSERRVREGQDAGCGDTGALSDPLHEARRSRVHRNVSHEPSRTALHMLAQCGPHSIRRASSRHPYGEHLAAHARAGRQVSVSWTSLDGLDKVELFGIECELIAAYRATRGVTRATSSESKRFIHTTFGLQDCPGRLSLDDWQLVLDRVAGELEHPLVRRHPQTFPSAGAGLCRVEPALRAGRGRRRGPSLRRPPLHVLFAQGRRIDEPRSHPPLDISNCRRAE